LSYALDIDSRLKDFLAHEIKDANTLEQQINMYSESKTSFEDFILVVYTGAMKFDSTPDNSLFLSKIGGFLEKSRPTLSANLQNELEQFYSKKSNQTMMRGMLLNTVKGLQISDK
jgi:hypothetical protein